MKFAAIAMMMCMHMCVMYMCVSVLRSDKTSVPNCA